MADNDDQTQTGGQGDAGTDGAQSGSGTGTDDGNNTNSNTSDDSTAQSGQADATVTRAEYDALRARMQAADQRASQREAELKQLRDKDLPEAEKLQRDFKELQENNAKLSEANKKLALDNAFLKTKGFNWKDPEAALKLADLSDVEIGEDGKVTGLDAALKKLAADKKYLLEDSDAQSGGNDSGASAPPMGGRGTQRGDNRKNKAALAKSFPALRSRG